MRCNARQRARSSARSESSVISYAQAWQTSATSARGRPSVVPLPSTRQASCGARAQVGSLTRTVQQRRAHGEQCCSQTSKSGLSKRRAQAPDTRARASVGRGPEPSERLRCRSRATAHARLQELSLAHWHSLSDVLSASGANKFAGVQDWVQCLRCAPSRLVSFLKKTLHNVTKQVSLRKFAGAGGLSVSPSARSPSAWLLHRSQAFSGHASCTGGPPQL